MSTRIMVAGMELQIAVLKADDWQQVREIYLQGIASGEATFETRAPDWEEWNLAHLERPRLVAIANDRIQGWAALSSVSRRQVYAGVAEVSVYVASASRGAGIGKSLLERMISESESCGIWTLQASIFPENEASIALHRRCGFREVGRRERIAQLDGKWRDTILLERRSALVGN